MNDSIIILEVWGPDDTDDNDNNEDNDNNDDNDDNNDDDNVKPCDLNTHPCSNCCLSIPRPQLFKVIKVRIVHHHHNYYPHHHHHHHHCPQLSPLKSSWHETDKVGVSV